jgi:Rho-binding antiterminator
VERLGPESAEEVISVLADAFTGYPVMRHVLGPELESHHESLVRMFVMARVFRGEPMLGIRDGGTLIAAAIASFPGTAPTPTEFTALRDTTWQLLGAEAERQYAAYGEAVATFDFPPGAVHLNMIGARHGQQRRGLGRALLDAVQEIARDRPGSPGVELTTETAENVAYYTRQGFELAGHARIGPSLESWGLFRPNERKPYAPIACALHDRLEAAATRGRDSALIVQGPGDRTRTVHTRIVDLRVRGGAEFLVLGSGEEIRLDRIVALDGTPFVPDADASRRD